MHQIEIGRVQVDQLIRYLSSNTNFGSQLRDLGSASGPNRNGNTFSFISSTGVDRVEVPLHLRPEDLLEPSVNSSQTSLSFPVSSSPLPS